MKTKLILIEGIPGSGKTTLARKTAQYYRERGIDVNLFLEGESHPADLGWNACIPAGQYGEVLEKYCALKSGIEEYTRFEGEYAIVAYTQVKGAPEAFYTHMELFEVYDGRVPDDLFFDLHYNRWRKFGECAAQKRELNIFECAFMQNHVNELLFWRNADMQAVIEHHAKLIDQVKELSPALIYLSQADICETIARIAKERVSPDGNNWVDRCVAYCENSSFGKKHGVQGFEGMMYFFEIRKRLEMQILESLSIPHIVIENLDYDWGGVWGKMTEYIETLP